MVISSEALERAIEERPSRRACPVSWEVIEELEVRATKQGGSIGGRNGE